MLVMACSRRKKSLEVICELKRELQAKKMLGGKASSDEPLALSMNAGKDKQQKFIL